MYRRTPRPIPKPTSRSKPASTFTSSKKEVEKCIAIELENGCRLEIEKVRDGIKINAGGKGIVDLQITPLYKGNIFISTVSEEEEDE